MSKVLPIPDDVVTVEVDLVSSAIDQRSATGSNRQKGQRKGSHYSAAFKLQPMDHASALLWLDLRTESDTVIMSVPQPGLVIGAPGTTRVSGSGQAGASLTVKDFTPGYQVRKGQKLNHIGSDGLRRLYIADEAVTANGSGVAIIPLETMLTWPPENNDSVTFTDVRIEGFAAVDPGSWLQDGNGWHDIRFTVEEPG